VLLLGLSGWLRAADLPPAVTLDLPFAANQATPAWLGHPETPAASFATLNLPILAPDPNASLLVTVYFQENQGGFMRISWLGTQGAQVLSQNFYEGIGMANQRSLLIAPSTLVGDGSLNFQCDGSTLGIQRIKLEWLENKTALVSQAVKDTLVTPAVGATQGELNFNGVANPVEPGAWQDQLVTVPLLDSPLRVEQGVEFSVDLDKVPGAARLALQESGLPLGKHLVVWVNEKRAGSITPSVPDLQDDGFLTDASAATSYVGWRDGSFYVPVALLKEGINTLQLSDEDDADLSQAGTSASSAAPQTPLAVKNLTLQLNYLSTTSPVSVPDATPVTTPDTTPDATPAPVPANTDGAIQPHLSVSLEAPLPLSDSTSTPPTTTTP
jgi:hypothetical protein